LNFLIVTRDPVPGRVLKTWRPSVSLSKGSTKSEIEPDSSSRDATDGESSSPSPTYRTVRNKVDSEEEVIYVQTGMSVSVLNFTI